jgi:hypothetical protein
MQLTTVKAGPVLAVSACAGALSILYVVFDAVGASSIYVTLNMLGPSAVVVVCILAAYLLVRKGVFAPWSPVTWFFVACAAYYGLGPLAYHFATPESVAYMDTFHAVDEYALLRTNLLNVAGIGSVSLGILVGMALRRGQQPVRRTAHDTVMLRRATFVFLAVGGTVKYFFSLPYALGLLSWTLPGSIQHLSALLGGAIVLLFVLVHRGETRFRWILYPLIASELTTGLMTFSKQEVLWTLLTIFLGQYLCQLSFRKFVVSVAGLILLYALILSPFVSFARMAVGVLGTDDPKELASSLREFRDVGREQVAEVLPNVQGWWTRLAYSNAQAYVMEEYDIGIKGKTFGLAPYSFVPRVLYPDKPIMTSGKDFTALVTGEDSYHTGSGIFGEAYWNGGWWAVFAAGVYVGLVFAVFAAFSMRTMAAGQYIYTPVVMAGIVMGFRPDDWFVPTYVGSLVEIFVLYGVLRFLLIPLITSQPKGKKPGDIPPTSSTCAGTAK